MEQYICLNCEKIFRDPARVREPGTFGHFWRSPCCLDGFAPVMTCDRCGKLMAAGSDLHGLCRACAEAAVARLRYYLNNEFTDAEREILNDAFDGVPLTDPESAKVVGG